MLEVGIGGRLDATNIITPQLSIITTVQMDHMAILGDTIEKIAREKAGIIKPGVDALVGPGCPYDVMKVLDIRHELCIQDMLFLIIPFLN